MKQTNAPLGILIAVGNQKGGTGKTTNTVNIAAALGQRGFKCLIIDLVPDAGSTRHFGIPLDSYAGSLELLTTNESVQSLALTEGLPRGVHLIPSRRQLAELHTLISKFVHPTEILNKPVEEARKHYDFVLLDTAPDAGAMTTVAAYSVSEWFLLSAFPHPLSMAGLADAFNDIADVRQLRNPRLEVLGVIFSNVDMRTRTLRAELEKAVTEALPGRQFESVIPQAIALAEVSGKGKTIFQMPKYRHSHLARQYLRLSLEIEHRVLNRDAFLNGTLGPPDYSELGKPIEDEAAESQQREEMLVANG